MPKPRLLCLAAVCLVMGGCRPEPVVPPGVDVPIRGFALYALGAADLDGDGRDDLYTVNHNAPPSLLRSTGDAERPFEPLAASSGTLPHDPAFPALVALHEEPALPDSGALAYWLGGAFHLAAGRLAAPVRGTLTFRDEPVIQRADTAEAEVAQRGPTHWDVAFALESGGHLALTHEPKSAVGWPVTLALDSDTADVSIGRPGDHPRREGTFRLRDYHALAVRDLNGDGRPDIVALGGGLRGHAAELVPEAQETTFIATGDGYEARPGPPKLGCATLTAQWEGDTLRVTCARGQLDNLWTWDGSAWRGGPARVATGREPEERCASARMVAERRLRLPDEALCAEGDFDGDGALEIVIAVPGEDRVATAVLYDPDAAAR